MPVRTRACVVLVRGGEVCLVRCEIGSDVFHVFPGGGVEVGETPVEAARREAFEELGLEVEVGRLFARVDYERGTQLYYLATVTGGRFGTGSDNDKTFAPESGERIPLWMPIDEALMSDTRPSRLCELLAEGVEAFEGVQRIPY